MFIINHSGGVGGNRCNYKRRSVLACKNHLYSCEALSYHRQRGLMVLGIPLLLI